MLAYKHVGFSIGTQSPAWHKQNIAPFAAYRKMLFHNKPQHVHHKGDVAPQLEIQICRHASKRDLAELLPSSSSVAAGLGSLRVLQLPDKLPLHEPLIKV